MGIVMLTDELLDQVGERYMQLSEPAVTFDVYLAQYIAKLEKELQGGASA